MSDIELKPLAGGLGCEILNVDLAGDLSNSDFASIRQAFVDHGVIFFRDQELMPEDHISFAQRWGKININRFFTAVENHPQIAEVRKEEDQKSNIGGGWHTDHSYDEEPAMGSILYALDVPDYGGDTLFANMYLAYETLSDGLKKPCSACARFIRAAMCLVKIPVITMMTTSRRESAMRKPQHKIRFIRSSSPIPKAGGMRFM